MKDDYEKKARSGPPRRYISMLPPEMKSDYSCDISILRLLVAKKDRPKKEKKENIGAADKTEMRDNTQAGAAPFLSPYFLLFLDVEKMKKRARKRKRNPC